jgi:hypothetical protein
MPRTNTKKGSKISYRIGRLTEEEEDKLNFSDSLARTVKERIELGFIPMRLSIIDNKPYRIFNTMKEYREWCNRKLPEWLGYHTVND